MNITFTPSTGAAITFAGTIVYGTEFSHRRINQLRQECADGTDVVYDTSAVLKGFGTLVVKRLSYLDGEALRTWLTTVLIFQKYTFTISALTNVNLGKGKNTQVSGCRLLSNDTDGIFEYVAPGLYNVTLKYSF